MVFVILVDALPANLGSVVVFPRFAGYPQIGPSEKRVEVVASVTNSDIKMLNAERHCLNAATLPAELLTVCPHSHDSTALNEWSTEMTN